jgi:MoxR-like ATPase
VTRVASTEQLVALQTKCRQLFVDPSLIQFAVKVVAATRNPEGAGLGELQRFITYGASPRATINMIEAGRALAFLRGREYVLPEDVLDVTPDVLRHRLVLSYEAISESMTPDQVVGQVLKAVPAPDKPLEAHVRIAATG